MMQHYASSPTEMLNGAWRHRELIKTLLIRDVTTRYRGSVLGILWSFLHPAVLLTVYTFVFSLVFKSRWSAEDNSKTGFALVLFAGLVLFNLFAECLNRAPALITNNVNYVKKLVFPLEILPLVAAGSALFHALIGLLVWLLAYTFLYGAPQLSIVLMPLIFFQLLLIVLGLSWMLAALGVYLRDVSQFASLLTTLLMFLSPVFYPASALPQPYHSLMMLNPLTHLIEQARDVLFWGRLPEAFHVVAGLFASMLIGWLGFAFFQRARPGFADVL